MQEEIWKDVVGYEGLYQVSSFGNAKSYKSDKPIILSPTKNNNGYLLVGLYKNGCQKKLLIHRLVAEAFILNLENKPQVNHINGVKSDNRVENLEWSTASENQKHSRRIGLWVLSDKHRKRISEGAKKRTGVNSPQAKKVLDINTGIVYDTIKDASKHMNISIHKLSKIFNNKQKNTTTLRLIQNEQTELLTELENRV